VPENIGLCARTMKNTGFSDLVLVNPCLKEKSFQVAKRARDVLEKARICENLDQAVADSGFVFAATRRSREYKLIYDFRAILPQIVACAAARKTSIVFGREDRGLEQAELACCDSIFYLPADPEFSSYNLSFSLGLVCYLIFDFCSSFFSSPCLDLASKKDIEEMLCFAAQGLENSLGSRVKAQTMTDSLRRLLLRTQLTKKEKELLKTVFLKLT